MHVPDFEKLCAQLAQSEIDKQWQDFVAHLFERVPDLQDQEPFAMMQEVFYMPGSKLASFDAA